MRMSTQHLVAQLRHQLTQGAATAARSGFEARSVAQGSSEVAEKREDAVSTLAFANMAHAEALRVAELQKAVQALDGISRAELPRYDAKSPIGMGAIVEAMSEDDTGIYSRTFVLLPAGAGAQLSGPGGDGIISVVTPSSPVGRAMLGKRVGDVAEVTVRGEPMDWEILEVTC